MEVHKHPRHVTHSKKWPEYLIEFLMIFFAVFLGFYAENIREHSLERKKAKQYLEGFMEKTLKKINLRRTFLNTLCRPCFSIAGNIS